MITLIRIHALVRTAGVLVFIGRAEEYVRAASCRKAWVLLGEAAAWCDARDAAWRRAQARR